MMKISFRQDVKDGHVFCFAIAAEDVPDRLLKARLMTRFACSMVEIGDDEKPVLKEGPKDRQKRKQNATIMRAGIACKEILFHRFLQRNYNPEWTAEIGEGESAGPPAPCARSWTSSRARIWGSTRCAARLRSADGGIRSLETGGTEMMTIVMWVLAILFFGAILTDKFWSLADGHPAGVFRVWQPHLRSCGAGGLMQRRPRQENAKHLRFVRERPCIICGFSPCDAAHIKMGDSRISKPTVEQHRHEGRRSFHAASMPQAS